MSEGPYKCRVVGLCSGEVVDERTGTVVSESNHKDESYKVARMMNLAHAHATDAAARRVRELEEALRVASTMCVKCFGRGTYSTGCPCVDDPRWEPDYHNCGAYDAECDDSTCVKVRAALAGKERSDGAN